MQKSRFLAGCIKYYKCESATDLEGRSAATESATTDYVTVNSLIEVDSLARLRYVLYMRSDINTGALHPFLDQPVSREVGRRQMSRAEACSRRVSGSSS